MTKEYINIRLEVGSLAYYVAEEAVKNKKVVSKHLSECLESMEEKKNEWIRYDFDRLLGTIEAGYGNEQKEKVGLLWPLIIGIIINEKNLNKKSIDEIKELIFDCIPDQ